MQPILEKLKPIKLLVADVDGVFTDGILWLDNDGKEIAKNFHAHDGIGIKLLQKTGVMVAIITARTSDIVQQRMQALGITHIYQGNEDKRPALQAIMTKLNLPLNQVAYVGDDLPDLPLMLQVGCSIAVANATPLLLKHADWCTQKIGGHGAIREICDFIMLAQGNLNAIQAEYLLS